MQTQTQAHLKTAGVSTINTDVKKANFIGLVALKQHRFNQSVIAIQPLVPHTRCLDKNEKKSAAKQVDDDLLNIERKGLLHLQHFDVVDEHRSSRLQEI
jgi:hypothetical protein